MKISDLKDYKTVKRPKTDSNGNRIVEEIEFNVEFNPTIKKDSYRLFAKIIDILIAISILLTLDRFSIFSIHISIFFFPIVLILLNAILESVIGSSIGKLIVWIEVVNNDCKYLNLIQSLKRNLLFFLILFSFLLSSEIGLSILEYYDKKMNQKHFYVIPKSKKKGILRRLQK